MRIPRFCFALAAAALLGAAVEARAQSSFFLNFDGPGTTAQSFAPANMIIGYGAYQPSLDGFGDPIPGSDHWVLDSGSVSVLDPSTVGWGPAPSLSKALDARDGTVLLSFDTPISFTSFSTKLDNSSFGNLFNSPVEFYGASNQLLFSAPVDQTVAGFTVNVGALSGVTTIVLPGGAFYDNITAVPEPSTFLLGFGCVAGALLRHRLRRRA